PAGVSGSQSGTSSSTGGRGGGSRSKREDRDAAKSISVNKKILGRRIRKRPERVRTAGHPSRFRRRGHAPASKPAIAPFTAVTRFSSPASISTRPGSTGPGKRILPGGVAFQPSGQ